MSESTHELRLPVKKVWTNNDGSPVFGELVVAWGDDRDPDELRGSVVLIGDDGDTVGIPAEHLKTVALALLSPSDSLTVRIDSAGAAHLLALDDEGDGCGITIPKERRREIAEKLIGDEG